MHTNFFDRFADGFLFGLFVNSRPMFCCQSPYMPSSPYIPSVDRSLLNSVFELSIQNTPSKVNYTDTYFSLPSEPRATLTELPMPLVSASPSINTPYSNGGLYSFFPPSYQIDYALLNPLMTMQSPTFGLLNLNRQTKTQEQAQPVQQTKKEDPKQEQLPKKTVASTANENESVKPKENKPAKEVVPERKSQYNSMNREFAQAYRELGITDTRFQKILEECVLPLNEGREPGKDADVIWDERAYNKNGVLQDTYDEYRDKKRLPRRKIAQMTQKEMCEIYYTMYYVASGANKITNDKMALYVFDSAVNMGPGTGKKLYAKSGNNPSKFEEERRKEYSRKANFADNKNGWYNRISKTKAYADKNLV